MKKRSLGHWFKGSLGSAAWIGLCVYGCIAQPVDSDDQTQTPPQTGGGAGVGAGATAGVGVGGAVGGGAGVAAMTGGVGGGAAGTAPATGGTPSAAGGMPGVGGAAAGTGPAGTGNTPAVGGSAGVGAGGTEAAGAGGSGAGVGPAAGTGGGAGTVGAGGTAGTASGTGGSGGINSDPLCKGIKTNMACANEGISCPGLACGLADSGRRDCACATNWTCTSCDFTGSPFATAPASPATCTTQADGLACTTLNEVCIGAPNTEVCACYLDDEGAMIWDCDKQPSSW